jgi:hypothetical protein
MKYVLSLIFVLNINLNFCPEYKPIICFGTSTTAPAAVDLQSTAKK